MAKITKEELLKIARMSHIKIYDNEIDELTKQIDDVLSYSVRVAAFAKDTTIASDRLVNVTREDIVIKTDPEPLLAQAPDRSHDFFVVPKIIESSE